MTNKPKELRVLLTEDEHKALLKIKGKTTWRDFLLSMIESKEEIKA